MAALTKDRNTRFRSQGTHRHRTRKLAAVKCYKGGIACINAAGYLTPLTDAAGLIAVGIFQATVDNSAGAAGALDAPYVTGVEAELDNGGGVIVQSSLLATGLDDQTASIATTTVHDVKLGPIVEFSTTKAWVFIDEAANTTVSV